jgi:hypothetical protein
MDCSFKDGVEFVGLVCDGQRLAGRRFWLERGDLEGVLVIPSAIDLKVMFSCLLRNAAD